MPRHFTQQDRDAIHERLLAAGLKRFTQYGLRGMRVEDVCRDTGIAKGTFYNFFEHKEALFLAIAEQRDTMHKAEILAFFTDCPGTAAEQIGKFFDLIIEKMLADPLIAIVSEPEDLAALLRKMPPERLVHEEKKDMDFLVAFCRTLEKKGAIGPTDPQDAAGLISLLVCLVLQRALLTERNFAASCALLRDMFIHKLAVDPQ